MVYCIIGINYAATINHKTRRDFLSWKFFYIVPYTIGFSSLYSLFELYSKPCGLLPWCTLNWLGLDLYQYGFMFPLFAVVATLPVADELVRNNRARLYAIATFLLAVLSEDLMYFVLARQLITPGMYTTQWGYVQLAGIIFPVWYIFFGAGTIIIFYVGYARVDESGIRRPCNTRIFEIHEPKEEKLEEPTTSPT